MNPADIPVDIGRDEARRAAERELSGPGYDHPSLVDRIVRWLLVKIGELLSAAADAAPGGYAGLLVVVLLVVLAVVAIRLGAGRIGRAATSRGELFDARPLGSAEHRRAADQLAADGRWAEAVRERLRAVVRALEERDLLDVRAGRTADEAAGEAGRVFPAHAEQLRAAARTFDDVWYGGRPATEVMDAQLRAVDEALRRSRPDTTIATSMVGGSTP